MREMALEDWGNVANVVMALAAIAALWYATLEVKSARDDSREATAKSLRMEYLLRALDYPDLANPYLDRMDFEMRTYKGSYEKFDDYTWFVAFMLLHCDELLRLRTGKDEWDWEQIVKNNMSFHWAYLNSPAFAEYDVLSPRLRQQIEEMKTALPQAAV